MTFMTAGWCLFHRPSSTFSKILRFTKDLVIADMVEDIAEGPALDDGALLIRGISSETIYLLDHGMKRPIASSSVMEKYGFNQHCVVVVQQILINAIPTGDVWE